MRSLLWVVTCLGLLCGFRSAYAELADEDDTGEAILITYQQLMYMNPNQRVEYIQAVARAVSNFETASQDRLSKMQVAELDDFREDLLAYLQAMPEARADGLSDLKKQAGHLKAHIGYCEHLWSASNCDQVPNWKKQLADVEGQIQHYDPNRSTATAGDHETAAPATAPGNHASPPAPAAETKPGAPRANPRAGPPAQTPNPKDSASVEADAKKCDVTHAKYNQYRREYYRLSKRLKTNWCLIGGAISTYDGDPAPGKCKAAPCTAKKTDQPDKSKPDKQEQPDENSGKRMTQCETSFVCNNDKDHTPVCLPVTATVFKQCYALANDKSGKYTNKGCVDKNSEHWNDYRKQLGNFCSSKDPETKKVFNQIFCIECLRFHHDIEAANTVALAQQPGGSGTPARSGSTP